MDLAIANHLADLAGLFDPGMDEFLPAKAGVHRHHQHHVNKVEQLTDRAGRGAGVERHAAFHTLGADRLHGAVDMGGGLDMGNDHVGASGRVSLDIGVYRRDHQVHVHEGLYMRAERRHGGGAKGQVGDKMSVHHVHMHPITALGFDGLNLLAEIGEIGGQDRRGDFYGTVKGHGLSPVIKRVQGGHCCPPRVSDQAAELIRSASRQFG